MSFIQQAGHARQLDALQELQGGAAAGGNVGDLIGEAHLLHGCGAVAAAQEVKKGSAQIISTVDGNSPQTYDIEIVKVNYKGDGEKDIVFKVKDDKLIEKTGGIVQGMSGSPIIQNNKLVGAVTHVIVDNPKKGYGIFAQTMYEKSNNVK